MHDSLIKPPAPGEKAAPSKLLATYGYRIGVLTAESGTEPTFGGLQAAAERLGHTLLPTNDAAQLGPTVDFALATIDLSQKLRGLPIFGLIREAKTGFR